MELVQPLGYSRTTHGESAFPGVVFGKAAFSLQFFQVPQPRAYGQPNHL